MTTELMILTWSVLLGFVYIMAATVAVTKIRGTSWNIGARDEQGPELTGVAARLDRASQNFKETFPLFLAAVLINEFVVRTTGRTSSLSIIGAHMYLWARVLYLPVYAFGIPIIRTFIWVISAIGILLVLSTAFLAL